MSEYHSQFNLIKLKKGFKKLTDDLAVYGANTSSTLMVDSEMLSLVVSDVLNGADISTRYPAFYRKILNDVDLRQAFIDAVGSMENIKQSESVVLPFPIKPSLAFLSHSHQPEQPTIIKLGSDKWRTIWRQSIEQLQSIFSPPELAYRSDPSLFEDPWITLLRGETEIDGSMYTFMLECSPTEECDEALAVSFNIAVTLETPLDMPQASLEATLQWGFYNETIAISEEGRTRFPNIPLTEILDEGQQNFKAELSLALEKIS
jgi:hypothetical protein